MFRAHKFTEINRLLNPHTYMMCTDFSVNNIVNLVFMVCYTVTSMSRGLYPKVMYNVLLHSRPVHALLTPRSSYVSPSIITAQLLIPHPVLY